MSIKNYSLTTRGEETTMISKKVIDITIPTPKINYMMEL